MKIEEKDIKRLKDMIITLKTSRCDTPYRMSQTACIDTPQIAYYIRENGEKTEKCETCFYDYCKKALSKWDKIVEKTYQCSYENDCTKCGLGKAVSLKNPLCPLVNLNILLLHRCKYNSRCQADYVKCEYWKFKEYLKSFGFGDFICNSQDDERYVSRSFLYRFKKHLSRLRISAQCRKRRSK